MVGLSADTTPGRMEHPNQLMILRIYTVAPTSFLQPAEKLILPLAMGPMAVIGRGRPSGGQNSGKQIFILLEPVSLVALATKIQNRKK